MIKKKLLAFAVAIIFVFGATVPTAFAQEQDIRYENSINNIKENIETVQDIAVAQPKSIGFIKSNTVVKTFTKNDFFCGYMTDVWMPAKDYQVSKGMKKSFKVEVDGFGVTIEYIYNATATIPADPSKYSRLGAYADVTFQKIKTTWYNGGAVHKVTYSIKPTKYADKTLKVIYK